MRITDLSIKVQLFGLAWIFTSLLVLCLFVGHREIESRCESVELIFGEFTDLHQATQEGRAVSSRAEFEALVGRHLESARAEYESVADQKAAYHGIVLPVLILCSCAGLAIFIVVVRGFVSPILRALQYLDNLGHGKLYDRMRFDRRDELGILTRGMDAFMDTLLGEVLPDLQHMHESHHDKGHRPSVVREGGSRPAVPE